MATITAFSWGFWGWGSATRQLIAAVDAAEADRGFKPPLFVDVRFKRGGRAPGFQGDAFERLLGHHRYRWMPSLGNKSLGTGNGASVAYPASVRQLLDLALDAHDQNRRVIFFCACESPWYSHTCHRARVARLFRADAHKRNVRLKVEEWPGGEPPKAPITVRIPRRAFDSIKDGGVTVRLGVQRLPRNLAGLPWGTPVLLRSGRYERLVAGGPVQFRARHWVLPRFDEYQLEDSLASLRAETTRLRTKFLISE